MEKPAILIYHHQGLFYGSTEKLLQLLAKYLTKDFEVFFAYGQGTCDFQKGYLENTQIKLVPYEFESVQNREPYKVLGMKPDLLKIIEENKVRCVIAIVYAHYQFPINEIPASIPIILISPFGHFCSNGNVAKTYVSGIENLNRLKNRGIKNAEMLFNPLEDFSKEILGKKPIGEQVIFGRIGRGDDAIFDPIAVWAFKKLEDKYGSMVKYIVANPPPAWKKLAVELGIKNMEFRPPLTQIELLQFYYDIDVFAHARLDGETVGIAIGEAMLAGNPILTHKSAHHNEHLNLLDPIFAKWCEVGDAEGYFNNMAYMVEHKGEIRQMGKLARTKALSIFGIDVQLPKFVAEVNKACQSCKHYDSLFVRIKGQIVLFWNNLKVIPFYIGKKLSYIFPSLETFGRKIYRINH